MGYLLPNRSSTDRLSIFIWIFFFEASSSSSILIPFGVKIIFFGSKPALSPNSTSWIDTVSKPAPKLFKNFKIDILGEAFTA